MTRFEARKKEPLHNVYTTRADRRFAAFRPAHVLRKGTPRLSEYDLRHARQAVRDMETIEAFFHAQKMRAAGFHVGFRGEWRR